MRAIPLYADQSRCSGLSFKKSLRVVTGTLPSFVGSNTNPLPGENAPTKLMRKTAFRVAHKTSLPSWCFRHNSFSCFVSMLIIRRLPRFNPTLNAACGAFSSASFRGKQLCDCSESLSVVRFVSVNTESTSIRGMRAEGKINRFLRPFAFSILAFYQPRKI